VAKIFEAKGRPANHPLIVHVASAQGVQRFASHVPDFAQKLIDAFWPGPLTLILPRRPEVAAVAAGGQNSVGLRCPSHPVAHAVLETAEALGVLGLAAPSANLFGRVSPTTAAHVASEFGDELLIIDGGACDVGIESTIIDLSSGDKPILLRPGTITPSEILAKTGIQVYQPGEIKQTEEEASLPRVSGSLRAHYAPTTPLRLYAPGRVLDALSEFPDIKSRVAVAVWDSESSLVLEGHPSIDVEEVIVSSDSTAFASRLYRSLRDLDQQAWDLILFPEPPVGEEWDGVRDRLQRACFGSGPSSSSHASS
jgi:L-threonylcarbamoyladenylate synthase